VLNTYSEFRVTTRRFLMLSFDVTERQTLAGWRASICALMSRVLTFDKTDHVASNAARRLRELCEESPSALSENIARERLAFYRCIARL
jgi:hypothetical protein